MKEQIINRIDGNYDILCPHCPNWETHPEDEQRHHIQHFDLEEWLEDDRSLMKCHNCNNEFIATWK